MLKKFYNPNCHMNIRLFKDTIGWGFLLWLSGYILGIILFFVLPTSILGWVIMPFGILMILWVLLKKIKNQPFQYFVVLAISWTVIAIVFDYFFLVKVFKPADGYYKLDVYLYYLFTFTLPLIIGWRNGQTKTK